MLPVAYSVLLQLYKLLMVYLSIEQRSRIYALLEEGYPSRYVADKEGVSQSTVIRIKQCKVTTGTFKNKPKVGRPRLLTGRHERKVLRFITTGECTNAVAIQKNLKTEENIEVSDSTVKRTLRRNGLSSRIKRKKPYLRKKHRFARLKNIAHGHQRIGVKLFGQMNQNS